jgi:hypothetical protein
MYLVQPVLNKWNVVIVEVRHGQQIFPTSAIKRLDAHNRDKRDVEFFIAILWRRNRDS